MPATAVWCGRPHALTGNTLAGAGSVAAVATVAAFPVAVLKWIHTTRLSALWPVVFEVVRAGWQDLKDIREGAEKPERLPGGGKRWLLV